MSLALYRLGHLIGRHRLLVLVLWVVVALGVVAGSRAVGSAYQDDYTIPGTESQQGQDVLEQRFGDAASGASGQVLYRVADGHDVAAAPAADVVAASLDAIGAVPGVASVTAAEDLRVDEEGDAALATIQFEDAEPDDAVLEAAQDAATVDEDGVTSTVGGSAFGNGVAELDHTAEVIGVGVALVVLVLTFGSLLAAGMPILTAGVGVLLTTGVLGLVSQVAAVSTTSPSFASMLGLAVGIDYALFILSRHRHQLAEGVPPRESMARALGTSGSAVVFAGLTVVISLAGLAVVGIPLLTGMGMAGAFAVATAVLVALTLVPALALLAGDRLRPRPRRGAARRGSAAGRPSLSQRWVRLVTRVPALTIGVVVAVLAVLALPAFRISLALPDPSTQEVGTPERDHFDAVSETFGPGWNAPLLITADVLASTDPVATVDELADAVAAVPGVVAVDTATPNPGGDTALLRIVPEGAQSDPATVDLVHELRERAPAIEDATGVSDLRVTGTTAVNIDISEQLADALLPFGLTVVGLSFVLLLLVFRSVAVPLKATVGYVLSVGASFGAIVAVFQWGWFPVLLFGQSPGPVVSFLPIIVMGVLFGLAMDYEMFLVSRMREQYAHGQPAREAVLDGFRHSAPVVAAAAVIMVAVFSAFVPSGAATLKPIALGLAVGVLVDAFLVRMTLVPAVLVLLGDRAWWLPRRLARVLPVVDVEGQAVERHVAAGSRSGRAGPPLLVARGLVVREGDAPLDVWADAGDVVALRVADLAAARAVSLALTARARTVSGELAVAGRILPEQAEEARCLVAAPTAADVPGGTTAEEYARRTLALSPGSRRVRRARVDRVRAVLGDLGTPTDALDPAARLRLAATVALAGGARLLVLTDAPAGLAATLLRHGATVVRLDLAAAPVTQELETVR